MPGPVKFDRGKGDAPFNMAQLFYYRLNELIAHKTRVKLYGDLSDWLNCLQEIHTQICFKLSKEDNEKILNSIRRIQKYLYSPLPKNKTAGRQMQVLLGNRCAGWLGDLDRDIMCLMERHKMIFPRIDTRSPMETLREDMGLDPDQGVGL